MDAPSEAPENSTWGFTATLLWGVAVAIVYVLVQMAVTLTYATYVHGEISEDLLGQVEYDGTILSLATFAALLLCAPLVVAIIALKRNSSITDYLAIRKIDRYQIVFWSLTVLALIVITDSLTYLQGRPVVVDFMVEIYTSTSHLWLLVLALVVAAPLFEELFFRGFLLTGFSKTFLGPVGAVFVTSIAWSVIHLQYDLYGIFTIFVTGLVFGAARLKTNSILTTIMMHSMMNFVSTIETAIYVAA
jgi:membrane protease YdiL (CAAX protease family)